MNLENYNLEEIKKEVKAYSKELVEDRERLIKYGIIAFGVVVALIILKLIISALTKKNYDDDFYYEYDDFDEYDEYDIDELDLEDDFIE